MNSAFLESVQGFLNSRSVSHSVERWANVGVTPPSSSSQFSIGVTSTAAVGPMLDPPSLRFQPGATPSSATAVVSFSTGCGKAVPAKRNKDAIKTDRFVFTMPYRNAFTEALNVRVSLRCSRYGFRSGFLDRKSEEHTSE